MPSLLQTAQSAISIAPGPGPVERFGPIVVVMAGALVIVGAAFGLVPGGTITGALTALAGLGGFWVRHNA